jgi:hypothetical protein
MTEASDAFEGSFGTFTVDCICFPVTTDASRAEIWALPATISTLGRLRDEWDKGRPPTSTVEHNLPAGDQSNATFSTSLVPSAIPEIQSVTPIETAAFKATADLREKIRNEGLTPGTIVECFNNTSLDRW